MATPNAAHVLNRGIQLIFLFLVNLEMTFLHASHTPGRLRLFLGQIPSVESLDLRLFRVVVVGQGPDQFPSPFGGLVSKAVSPALYDELANVFLP